MYNQIFEKSRVASVIKNKTDYYKFIELTKSVKNFKSLGAENQKLAKTKTMEISNLFFSIPINLLSLANASAYATHVLDEMKIKNNAHYQFFFCYFDKDF